MKLSDINIEFKEAEYLKTKTQLLNSSKRHLENLFSEKLNVLYNQHQESESKEYEITEFMLQIIESLSGLKFFINKDILNRLDEFRINDAVKSYLISIYEIKREIDIINKSNVVYIDPNFSINIINYYLDSNICNEVHNCYEFKTKRVGNGKTTINTTSASLIGIEKSEKRYVEIKKNDRNMTVFQLQMNDLMAEISEASSELGTIENPYQQLQKIVKGQADLRELILKDFYYKLDSNIGKMEFYLNFHSLFRLLDSRNVLSREELEMFNATEHRTLKQYFYNDIVKNRYHIKE